MYNEKMLYVCDFDLRRGSGRNRATRQKTAALLALCPNTVLYSLKSGGLRLLGQMRLELTVCWAILRNPPAIVISRGFVGWLFQPLAKALGIVTVREVHADMAGELNLLPYKGLKLLVLRWLAKVSLSADKAAQIRIFNHPTLMAWFRSEHGGSTADFYSYNGYCPTAYSSLSKAAAIQKFGLNPEKSILVFTGAATKWHGVEYLVQLQRVFNEAGDKVQIVCGGGDMSPYDPERLCINFSPMDDKGCAELIRASSLCLLPVKDNRISPGNPLKLYDYICNKRYVVSQANMPGYSDEVEKHGVGITVDFVNPSEARLKILNYLTAVGACSEEEYPTARVAWSDRMAFWMEQIKTTVATGR